MVLLLVLAIGGVIGWLAAAVAGEGRLGIGADVAVGVLGSLLGFAIAEPLHLVPHRAAGVYLVCLAGAVVLVLVLRAVGVFGAKTHER